MSHSPLKVASSEGRACSSGVCIAQVVCIEGIITPGQKSLPVAEKAQIWCCRHSMPGKYPLGITNLKRLLVDMPDSSILMMHSPGLSYNVTIGFKTNRNSASITTSPESRFSHHLICRLFLWQISRRGDMNHGFCRNLSS